MDDGRHWLCCEGVRNERDPTYGAGFWILADMVVVSCYEMEKREGKKSVEWHGKNREPRGDLISWIRPSKRRF